MPWLSNTVNADENVGFSVSCGWNAPPKVVGLVVEWHEAFACAGPGALHIKRN